jgi:hypothetical protein
MLSLAQFFLDEVKVDHRELILLVENIVLLPVACTAFLSKNTDNILVEDHLPLPLLVPNDLRGLVRGEVLLALYSRLSFSSNLEE